MYAKHSGVGGESDAVEGLDARAGPFWSRETLGIDPLVCLFPDVKDFVDRAKGICLEFIVAVLTRDEDFRIVVSVDGRVSLGEESADERLLDPEGDVELVVIPVNPGVGIMDRRLAADQIDKAGRSVRILPTGLVQPSISPVPETLGPKSLHPRVSRK